MIIMKKVRNPSNHCGVGRFATALSLSVILCASLSSSRLLADSAEAGEELNYGIYSLSVDVESSLANDTMTVFLTASDQDKDPTDASDAVNEAMGWALNLAAEYDSVKVQSTGYRTQPEYKNGKIVNWRASQKLQLVGEEFSVLSELVGRLQERLTVDSMRFSASQWSRSSVEDDLTATALQRFQERSETIRKTMAAGGYRILNVTINVGGQRPVIRQPVEVMATSLSREAVGLKAEAGESKVTVSASGQIHLMP